MQSIIVFASIVLAVSAVDFEIRNNMGGPIWVGIAGNANKPALNNGGLFLKRGQAKIVRTNDRTWAGHFWARTWCDSRRKTCQTGDCGSRFECRGNSGAPPASLAEIKLRGYAGQDFYDISLVDGFNAKIQMEPVGGRGQCRPLRCLADIKSSCPNQLKKKGGANGRQTVGCYSSCSKFNTDRYCCRNQFGSPQKCNTRQWKVNSAAYFKRACPDAYSYAYDDATSTFTCVANKYRITFS